MPRFFRTVLTLCVVALAAVFVFAACNDDDDGGDGNGGDTSGVPELEDGVLNVGSDIAYAPFEFFEEGTETPDGLDIDLAEAIAAELGVEVEFLNTGFDGIIPSLEVEDFDVLISAMTITDERSEVSGAAIATCPQSRGVIRRLGCVRPWPTACGCSACVLKHGHGPRLPSRPKRHTAWLLHERAGTVAEAR